MSAWLLLCSAGCASQALAPSSPPSLLEDVTFTERSELSLNTEIARRTLTPLTYARLREALLSRPALLEQPIDLTKEKFTVYVPAGARPQGGYGLLVFVAPWAESTRPQSWRPPLNRHGLIFVSAENSGNEAKVLDRRLPLALLAYENVRARYPLDPKRVYIGGLSGGSRVAEMVALAYPDVFRGALLNAGSDPIGGEEGIYLPPEDLFRTFQHTRLVYITGEKDDENLSDDRRSRTSMREWCVFNIRVLIARRLAHEPLDAVSLDLALTALDGSPQVDADEAARCNARVQGELTSQLAGAKAAIARGDRIAANAQINAIDRHYAGVAAPAILQLDAELAERSAKQTN